MSGRWLMIAFASLFLSFSLLPGPFWLLSNFYLDPQFFLLLLLSFLFSHPTGGGGMQALSCPLWLTHTTHPKKILSIVISRYSCGFYLCQLRQSNRQQFCLMVLTLDRLCIIGPQLVHWFWVKIVYAAGRCWAIARRAVLVCTAVLLDH